MWHKFLKIPDPVEADILENPKNDKELESNQELQTKEAESVPSSGSSENIDKTPMVQLNMDALKDIKGISY